MQKIVNGVYIDLTAEELAEIEVEDAHAITARQVRIDVVTASENNKATGKAKLKDLGLTDNEIEALLKE